MVDKSTVLGHQTLTYLNLVKSGCQILGQILGFGPKSYIQISGYRPDPPKFKKNVNFGQKWKNWNLLWRQRPQRCQTTRLEIISLIRVVSLSTKLWLIWMWSNWTKIQSWIIIGLIQNPRIGQKLEIETQIWTSKFTFFKKMAKFSPMVILLGEDSKKRG